MGEDAKIQVSRREQGGDIFRDAFLRVLLDRLPSWEGYITESARTNKPIEVFPPNWDGPPFRVDIRSDAVTVCPLCDFGLDYISTATSEDLQERPHLVFAKVVSEIADFVSGRTVVAIKQRRWLFMKAGWDVRFVPTHDLDDARRAGASVIAWPPKA
jgi:hypothetical protein